MAHGHDADKLPTETTVWPLGIDHIMLSRWRPQPEFAQQVRRMRADQADAASPHAAVQVAVPAHA